MGNSLTFTIRNTKRLDFLGADILKNELEKAINAQVNNYLIDLHTIHFIDSYSFNVLLQMNEFLNQRGKSLYLINVSECAKELFDLTNLSHVLNIKMVDPAMEEIPCQ